ncbi:trypsin-1-like isoform X2 [Pieris brassicae]|uniref:trypsin-1-like isoform X2 n=1 Tax=Pieris brassicae TaxID=7116 RepID=UPI001E65FF29|nr:trypsin-1-like isoform X2 [Pieris brassicae]
MLIHLAIVFSLLACSKSLSEGDSCAKMDGSPGVCKAINDCPYAEDDFRRHLKPMTCGYTDFDPVICCGESVVVTTPKIRGRSRGRKTTTTEQPKEIQFSLECEKAERRGTKAYDKCLEYQEKYVYPCRPGPTTGNIRVDECSRKPEQLVTGGEDAYEGEFPHMALLGFGNNEIVWMCGGVIISERYVLTAGHCTVSRSQIELNKYVVPACLHDGGALFNNSAIVTGWGTTVFRHTDRTDVLQKATVEGFGNGECEKKFKNIRLMSKGFNSTTQLCYGDRVSNKDTCEGDSGGPLQVNHPTVRCMYWVIGITSWGKWCGIAGEPGIYTRVEHYVPWIEEIVWP